MSGDFILEKQAHLNRSTRGQWALYASHRQELERLLVPARVGGRVCVLGAGNCNDLDLPWMTQVFSQIVLVDIDGDALSRAVKFQKVDTSPRIRLHGGFDLTAIATQLGTWPSRSPTAAQVDACVAQSNADTSAAAAQLEGPFDVVLSPCVLSQLITPLRDHLGEGQPGFAPLLAAMRARHLRLMFDLLAPGGKGIFACDLFSSAVRPELPRIHKDRLADVMKTMLASGRFFSGLDPASIAAVLERHPALARQAAKLTPHPPWLWHLGLGKSYLVYALTFQKAAGQGRGSSLAENVPDRLTIPPLTSVRNKLLQI